MSTARQRVIAYIAFVVAFALAAHFAAPMGGGAAAFVVMWTPALAALAASVLTRRSLGAIGWRPWPIKWLAAGWIIPSLYAFPAYALVWLAGLGDVPSPTFLERARFTLGMPSEANWLVIVSSFGYIALVNLLPNMILTLGEEIGWRGFLVPELTGWVGFRRASLYSGVIWGAWHLPGILTGAYGTAGTPKAYQLMCFTILVIATAVVQAWLRMRSGSVWPSTIMHATHNGIIQAFFNRITADTGHTAWFIGEFGVALVPFTVAVAWYCWRHPPKESISTTHVVGSPAPALVILIVIALSPIAAGQSVSPSNLRGSVAERKAALTELAGNPSPDVQQMGALVFEGLWDVEADVRKEALEVIVGKMFSGRRSNPTSSMATLRGLRPTVLIRLQDPAPLVRKSAVSALLYLDLEQISSTTGKYRLPHQTFVELMEVYRRDISGIVRSQIVRILAQSEGRSEIQISGLLEALNDAESDVVRFAVIGIGEMRIAEGVDIVAALLSHNSMHVRLAAAQTLARMGKTARHTVPLLKQAIAVETNRVVRDTMGATERALLEAQ